MIKKFEEYISERYDYDDVPLTVNRHVPHVAISDDSYDSSYSKDFEKNIKSKKIVYSNEKYKFDIYYIETKDIKTTNIYKLETRGHNTHYIYFLVDNKERRDDVPEGIGVVYVGKCKSIEGFRLICRFNTDDGSVIDEI